MNLALSYEFFGAKIAIFTLEIALKVLVLL
jgi:hypothetical protein